VWLVRQLLDASGPLLICLTVFATTTVYAQVSDSPGSVNCPSTVNLTVTVTTEDGAVIPNALVILREDTLGQPRGVKVFESELRTESNGKATAAVPCNYLDVLVGANGFAPAAQKFLITRDAHTFSVPLKMYPITRTTEIPVPQPEPSPEMPPLPSRISESAQSPPQSHPTISVDEAKQLVGIVLRHQKFPSSSPYCSIENLDRNGRPFEAGYYAFAASCDFPNTQATSPWGTYLVSPRTGDVLNYDTCKRVEYRDLQHQRQVMLQTGTTADGEKKYREATGCNKTK